MNKAPLFRLSVMMFLQYAVWGAWLPLAGRYLQAPTEAGGLGFTQGQLGMILGLAGSAGAIAAPFIAGQLSDRYFRTERVLAALLLVGAVVKWVTADQTGYQPWLWLSIAYSILYMPTLALSNSLAFAHLTDSEKQFPHVRLWGTIGWIAASWIFPMIFLQQDLSFRWMPPFFTGPEHVDVTARLADSLRFAAGISVFYAIYCLTLPATHPNKEAREPWAFAKAFALLREPSFAVLVMIGLVISAIHNIYHILAGPYLSAIGLKDSEISPALTVGQFSEIAVMAVLGFFLKSLGFRKVLFIGALGYFLRYGAWAMTDWAPSVLVASQVLHGLCYACFFAAAFIYVDRIAPEDVRHSAQTVFGLIMLGGGPLLAGQASGWLGKRYQSAEGVMTLDSYSSMWQLLSWIGLGAALCLLLTFREKQDASPTPA